MTAHRHTAAFVAGAAPATFTGAAVLASSATVAALAIIPYELENYFDHQADETVLTTGNSAGGSSDAFNTVSGSGATWKFDTAHAKGTSAVRLDLTAGSSRSAALVWSKGADFRHYARAAAYMEDAPPVDVTFVRVGSSAQGVRIALGSDRVLELLAPDGTVVDTFATLAPLDAWFRVELGVIWFGSTRTAEARLFLDSDSETPDEVASGSY